MRRDRSFLFLAIGVTIAFILFNSFSGLWSRKMFVRSENPITERERLRVENDRLKSQVSVLRRIDAYTAGNVQGTPGFVYSRYPFNAKSELLISIGSAQGVKDGQIVLHKGFLLGKVIKTFETSSVVQTIFDSRFETAIKIGDRGVDALLKGGDEPKLTFIVKPAEVKEGESIYSTASGIPYGLPVGQVREYLLKDGDPFGEATIRLSYLPSEIDIIEVLK